MPVDKGTQQKKPPEGSEQADAGDAASQTGPAPTSKLAMLREKTRNLRISGSEQIARARDRMSGSLSVASNSVVSVTESSHASTQVDSTDDSRYSLGSSSWPENAVARLPQHQQLIEEENDALKGQLNALTKQLRETRDELEGTRKALRESETYSTEITPSNAGARSRDLALQSRIQDLEAVNQALRDQARSQLPAQQSGEDSSSSGVAAHSPLPGTPTTVNSSRTGLLSSVSFDANTHTSQVDDRRQLEDSRKLNRTLTEFCKELNDKIGELESRRVALVDEISSLKRESGQSERLLTDLSRNLEESSTRERGLREELNFTRERLEMVTVEAGTMELELRLELQEARESLSHPADEAKTSNDQIANRSKVSPVQDQVRSLETEVQNLEQKNRELLRKVGNVFSEKSGDDIQEQKERGLETSANDVKALMTEIQSSKKTISELNVENEKLKLALQEEEEKNESRLANESTLAVIKKEKRALELSKDAVEKENMKLQDELDAAAKEAAAKQNLLRDLKQKHDLEKQEILQQHENENKASESRVKELQNEVWAVKEKNMKREKEVSQTIRDMEAKASKDQERAEAKHAALELSSKRSREDFENKVSKVTTELEKAQFEISSMAAANKNLQETLQKVKEKSDAKAALHERELSESAAALATEKSAKETTQLATEQKIEALEKKLAEALNQIEALEKKLLESQRDNDNAQSQLKNIHDNELADSKTRIEDLEREVATKQHELTKLSDEVVETRRKSEGILSEERAMAVDKFASLETTSKEVQEKLELKIAAITDQLRESQAEIATLSLNNKKLQETTKKLESTIEEKDATHMRELQKSAELLASERAAAEIKLSVAAEQLENLQEKLVAASNQVEALDFQLSDNFVESQDEKGRLRDIYELELAEARMRIADLEQEVEAITRESSRQAEAALQIKHTSETLMMEERAIAEEKYRALESELRELREEFAVNASSSATELNLSRSQISLLSNANKNLQDEITGMKEDAEAKTSVQERAQRSSEVMIATERSMAAAKHAAAEQEIEKLQANLARASSRIEALELQLSDVFVESQDQQGRLNDIHEVELSGAETRIRNLELELKSLQQENSDQAKEIVSVKQRSEDLMSEARAKAISKQTALESSMQAMREELEGQVSEATKAKSVAEEKIFSLSATNKTLNESIQELNEKKKSEVAENTVAMRSLEDTLTAERSSFEVKHLAAQEKVEALQSKLRDALTQIENKEVQLSDALLENQDKEGQLKDIYENELKEVKARATDLENKLVDLQQESAKQAKQLIEMGENAESTLLQERAIAKADHAEFELAANKIRESLEVKVTNVMEELPQSKSHMSLLSIANKNLQDKITELKKEAVAQASSHERELRDSREALTAERLAREERQAAQEQEIKLLSEKLSASTGELEVQKQNLMKNSELNRNEVKRLKDMYEVEVARGLSMTSDHEEQIVSIKKDSEYELRLLRERMASTASELSAAEAKIKELENMVSSLNEQSSRHEEIVSKVKKNSEVMISEERTLSKKAQASLEATADKLRDDLHRAESKVLLLANEKKALGDEFQELRKSTEAQSLVHESALRSSSAMLETERSMAEAKYEAARTEIESLKKELGASIANVESLEAKVLENFMEGRDELEHMKETYENDLSIAAARIVEMEFQITSIIEDVSSRIQVERQMRHSSEAMVSTERAMAEAKCTALESMVDELREALEGQSFQSSDDRSRSQVFQNSVNPEAVKPRSLGERPSAATKYTAAEQEIEYLKGKVDVAKKKIETMQQQFSNETELRQTELQTIKETYEAKLGSSSARIEELETKLAETKDSAIRDRDSLSQNSEKDLAAANDKIAELTTQLARAQSELATHFPKEVSAQVSDSSERETQSLEPSEAGYGDVVPRHGRNSPVAASSQPKAEEESSGESLKKELARALEINEKLSLSVDLYRRYESLEAYESSRESYLAKELSSCRGSLQDARHMISCLSTELHDALTRETQVREDLHNSYNGNNPVTKESASRTEATQTGEESRELSSSNLSPRGAVLEDAAPKQRKEIASMDSIENLNTDLNEQIEKLMSRVLELEEMRDERGEEALFAQQRFDAMRNSLTSLSIVLQEMADSNKTLCDRITELESEMALEKGAKVQLEARQSDAEKKAERSIIELTSQLEKSKALNVALKREVKSHKDTPSSSESRTLSDNDPVSEFLSQEEDLCKRLDDLRKASEQNEKSLREQMEGYRVEAADQEDANVVLKDLVARLNDMNEGLENSTKKLSSKVSHLEIEKKNFTQSITKLQNFTEALRNGDMQKEFFSLQEEAKFLRKQKKALTQEIVSFEERLGSVARERESLIESEAQLQKRMDALVAANAQVEKSLRDKISNAEEKLKASNARNDWLEGQLAQNPERTVGEKSQEDPGNGNPNDLAVIEAAMAKLKKENEALLAEKKLLQSKLDAKDDTNRKADEEPASVLAASQESEKKEQTKKSIIPFWGF